MILLQFFIYVSLKEAWLLFPHDWDCQLPTPDITLLEIPRKFLVSNTVLTSKLKFNNRAGILGHQLLNHLWLYNILSNRTILIKVKFGLHSKIFRRYVQYNRVDTKVRHLDSNISNAWKYCYTLHRSFILLWLTYLQHFVLCR